MVLGTYAGIDNNIHNDVCHIWIYKTKTLLEKLNYQKYEKNCIIHHLPGIGVIR